MASSDETKTVSEDLLDSDEEKGIFQVICYMPYTRGERVLICSRNENISGTAITTVVTSWLTYCHSPKFLCLLHCPNRWIKWKWGRILHILEVGTNLCSPLRNKLLLLDVYIQKWKSLELPLPNIWGIYSFLYIPHILGRGTLVAFIFLPIMALNLQMNEKMWNSVSCWACLFTYAF